MLGGVFLRGERNVAVQSSVDVAADGDGMSVPGTYPLAQADEVLAFPGRKVMAASPRVAAAATCITS